MPTDKHEEGVNQDILSFPIFNTSMDCGQHRYGCIWFGRNLCSVCFVVYVATPPHIHFKLHICSGLYGKGLSTVLRAKPLLSKNTAKEYDTFKAPVSVD
jgi:hypothetical protein